MDASLNEAGAAGSVVASVRARPSVAAVIGASGGIGAAIATRLVAAGVVTLALSRRATAIAGARPGTIDIEDEASIASAAALAGPVDLVVVATGLLQGHGVVPERSMRVLDPAQLARLFAINAIGPALVAKHFLPLMPRRGRTVFAALSARVGSIGDNRLGGWHGYRASKAALNQLIRCLAIEQTRVNPESVVVGLHPGTVDTRLSAPFQRGVAPSKLFTPDFSAERLLAVVDGLGPEDSGGCFAWDGQRIVP